MEENLGLTVLVLPASVHPRVGVDLQESHLPVHTLALAPRVALPAAPGDDQLSSSAIRRAMPMVRGRGSLYISTVQSQKTEVLPLHRVQKTEGEEAEEADNSSGSRCGGFYTLFK